MTLAETRAELDALWEDWERRGEDLKDPYFSAERLESVFRAASGERREEIEQVFCEWVSADEEGLRMVARGLLLDYGIQRGVAPLRARARQLAVAEYIGLRWERQQALDFAINIEAAGGYDRLVSDDQRLSQATKDAPDQLDAESRLPEERNWVEVSVADIHKAASLLAAWQHDRNPGHLAALAEMVTANWAPDYSLSKLLLAICGAALDASG